MKKEAISGMIAYLKEPYRGYRAVELVEKVCYMWLVEIVGCGLMIEVYEDELEME
jgi:hypothetical protein